MEQQTEEYYNTLKVKDLQKNHHGIIRIYPQNILKDRELSILGKKHELVQRLLDATDSSTTQNKIIQNTSQLTQGIDRPHDEQSTEELGTKKRIFGTSQTKTDPFTPISKKQRHDYAETNSDGEEPNAKNNQDISKDNATQKYATKQQLPIHEVDNEYSKTTAYLKLSGIANLTNYVQLKKLISGFGPTHQITIDPSKGVGVIEFVSNHAAEVCFKGMDGLQFPDKDKYPISCEYLTLTQYDSSILQMKSLSHPY